MDARAHRKQSEWFGRSVGGRDSSEMGFLGTGQENTLSSKVKKPQQGTHKRSTYSDATGNGDCTGTSRGKLE